MDDLEVVNSDNSISKKLKPNEDTVSIDLENSTSAVESDMSYHDDEDNDQDDGGNDTDDYSDYYEYDDDTYDADEDNYAKMQSQFDNVDLPPGVEISLPWLKDPGPSEKAPSQPSLCATHVENKNPSLCVAHVENKKPSFTLVESKTETAASSSSTIIDEEEREVEILGKLEQFKRFDTVENFSDHHYLDAGLSGQKIPDKKLVKKIQEEWKILEENLPDTIYVRVSEARMDLLKAVIVGPAGTPYHDGLFSFDALFPPNYPNEPPMVYYYSGGLRLNPNLYDCGKVCLSLLGTWHGEQNEMWIPSKSTMLQVLVSIQALILNENPFFNEPGYDRYVGEEGKRQSNQYNDDVFILSLKTMMYTLRNPPKHFEDLVVGHFYRRAHEILEACKTYTEGAAVGSVVKEASANSSRRFIQCTHRRSDFTMGVQKMMKSLSVLFMKNGSKDLEKFLPPA